LTELLVVMAIIALLAALIIGLYPQVQQGKLKRALAENKTIETLIEVYKEKKGYYPPDTVTRTGLQAPAGQSSLYYELTGTGDAIIAADFLDPVNPLKMFLNSLDADPQFQNFFKTIRPSNYKEYKGSATNVIRLLGLPAKNPGPDPDFAFWYYDSSSSNRHNHESFDLWTDIIVNGKTNRVKNWRE
jgi:type II secretory pathway pseudopilin PulG